MYKTFVHQMYKSSSTYITWYFNDEDLYLKNSKRKKSKQKKKKHKTTTTTTKKKKKNKNKKKKNNKKIRKLIEFISVAAGSILFLLLSPNLNFWGNVPIQTKFANHCSGHVP